MAGQSVLRITVEFHPYPEPVSVGVLATADGITEVAMSGAAPSLRTPEQIRRWVNRVVTSWYNPELFAEGASATADVVADVLAIEPAT